MGKGAKKVKETADQKAAARVGVEQWNEYAQKWAPKIQQWAGGIAADKAVDKDIVQGITNADLAQATQGVERGVTMTGMNPNSGRAMKVVAGLNDTAATAGSGAAVTATQGVESNQIAGLQQVANVGMGQKTEALDSMYDIAGRSVNEAINNAGFKQQSHQATTNMIMSGAGAAAGMAWDKYKKDKETEND